MPAKFKRTGLHRLNCPMCSGYAYSTVANLETVGRPRCACGETMQPERIELALLIGADDAPVMQAYQSKTQSVAHGQAWSRRGSVSPDVRAVEIIATEQRKAARARRLNALLPTPEPMPF